MNADELKKHYGEEYPAAVRWQGLRLPLKRERRFSRLYEDKASKQGLSVSRFMDGSATMTLAQLKDGWPDWAERDREDFCQMCVWLREQEDYPEMLRFVMRQDEPEAWSAIALTVATNLPQAEAWTFLTRILRRYPAGRAINLTQAIAKTRHPEAKELLRRHLDETWTQQALWEDDKFLNWVAHDAITCIRNLIELGATTAEFEEQVRKLSQHVCERNRGSCRRFLGKYYPWLQE